jgi:hypothetical protein
MKARSRHPLFALSKLPVGPQVSLTKNKRNTTTHQFASIVARNIHEKLKVNVGK